MCVEDHIYDVCVICFVVVGGCSAIAEANSKKIVQITCAYVCLI